MWGLLATAGIKRCQVNLMCVHCEVHIEQACASFHHISLCQVREHSYHELCCAAKWQTLARLVHE